MIDCCKRSAAVHHIRYTSLVLVFALSACSKGADSANDLDSSTDASPQMDVTEIDDGADDTDVTSVVTTDAAEDTTPETDVTTTVDSGPTPPDYDITVTEMDMGLTYKGFFRMPNYSQPLRGQEIRIAKASDNSLFYGGGAEYVGEIGIAEPINAENLADAPIGDDLQPPVLATRERAAFLDSGNGYRLTGLDTMDGRLYVNHGMYYDVSNQPNSGFCSVDPNLSLDNFEGFYPFDIPQAKPMEGWIFHVPSTWALGSRYNFIMGSYWDSATGGPVSRGAVLNPNSTISSEPVLQYDRFGIGAVMVPNYVPRDRYWDAFGVEVGGNHYMGTTVHKASHEWWYGQANPWTDPLAHRQDCEFNAGDPIWRDGSGSCAEEWNALGAPLPPLTDGETRLDNCFVYKGYHATSFGAVLYLFNEDTLASAADAGGEPTTPITVDVSEYMKGECRHLTGAEVVGDTLYLVETRVDDSRSRHDILPIIHAFEIHDGSAD